MGYIAFNANTVTAQEGGTITGTSINVGSGSIVGGATFVTSLNAGAGTILTSGLLGAGATTVTSLNAGAGAITTTGTLGAGATTLAGALTSYSLNIVNGGTGAISTLGTITGSTITASTTYNTSGTAGYQVLGVNVVSSARAITGSGLLLDTSTALVDGFQSRVIRGTQSKPTGATVTLSFSGTWLAGTFYVYANYGGGTDRTSSKIYNISSQRNSAGGNMIVTLTQIADNTSAAADFNITLTVGTLGPSSFIINLNGVGSRNGLSYTYYVGYTGVFGTSINI